MDTSQFNVTFSMWLSAFLVMSATSLVFALVLCLKSRGVKKIPKNLTATIFSKTFNVFDPFSESRSMFQSDFFFLFTELWVMVLAIVACVEIFVSGFLLELSIFFLCLGLMMISEATEAYSVANTLVKAVKRQTGFGQGDVYAVAMVKKTIDRLTIYYILLSVLFAALFFTMPYMLPALVLGFSQFVGLITSLTIGMPFISPFVAALLFALSTLAVFRVAGKMKAAFFGFLPSDLFETDEIMGRWILHERA